MTAVAATTHTHRLFFTSRMLSYTGTMPWEIEYTDEFAQWWGTLTAKEQDGIDPGVLLLQEQGPAQLYDDHLVTLRREGELR